RGLNPVDILIIEPAGRQSLPCCEHHPALTVLARAQDIPSDFKPDVVVFAVKPQLAADVVPQYAQFTRGHPVFLSIIAGKTIGFFKQYLGAEAAVVRAMPNTPAAIGKGISVLTPAPEVSPIQRQICDKLMTAAGQVAWLDDESLMDAVTAVSGSGPAYVFLLAETLAEAGRKAGLPDDLAAQLARATVSGSGALLEQSPESAAKLRENVTSPNGTTAAALKVLMAEGALGALMKDAVAAATQRSRELSG
ncbi:MAG: pyrroline-5-carboxylate reductase, partial [Rhodospirillaceae bacterium]|nr:pyrroline-5-carboxylate reductase [Rhodospirillaceae bacterium]